MMIKNIEHDDQNIDHGPIGPRRERAARGLSLRIHMNISNFHEQLSMLCHAYGDLGFIGPATKIMHLFAIKSCNSSEQPPGRFSESWASCFS
jgi:hypothetical protein